MYIFLPDANDWLSALAEKAGSESGFLERHIPSKSIPVRQFRIPKFKFEYEIQLSEALKTLGLVFPFDEEKGLVREEETVAAAATVVDADMVCCLEEEIEEVSIDFVADHPFLFFIREDKTGLILFIGQLLNPSTP
ncbi:hypothetical protein AgCh_012902 [Apium graveolens]